MLSSSPQARAPQSLAERLGACPVSQGISLNETMVRFLSPVQLFWLSPDDYHGHL